MGGNLKGRGQNPNPFLGEGSVLPTPPTERIAVMGNLTQEQLAVLIANVVSQVMQGQSATPKASSHFLPKGSHAAPSDLAS